MRAFQNVCKPAVVLTYMLPACDPPGPVPTMFPSYPFYERRTQGEIRIPDLLHAKVDPVVHQPSVSTQSIPLFTRVPEGHGIVWELTHPHQAYRAVYTDVRCKHDGGTRCNSGNMTDHLHGFTTERHSVTSWAIHCIYCTCLKSLPLFHFNNIITE